jgi:DNA processing protein
VNGQDDTDLFSLQLSDKQRLDWLRLIRTDGVGPRMFRSLINRFGGAGPALEALPELARRGGRDLTPYPLARAEKELERLSRYGGQFLMLGDPLYPELLAQIDAAPPLISVKGDLGLLKRRMVAIVGSRNASAVGLKMAEQLAQGLARLGYVLVSGLARGIDGQVHHRTLATGTVAVLAGGVEHVYPSEHKDLHRQISEQGVLVSEMPFGWEPRGRDFPRRNRIISGLACAVIVVEAAERSGSLITARFATEQGREVMAVPGSPLDPRAAGTNGLIREGATLITSAEQVDEAIKSMSGEDNWHPHHIRETADEAEPLWDEIDYLNENVSAPTMIRETPETSYRGGEPDNVARSPQTDIQAGLLSLMGPAPIAIDDLVRLSGSTARETSQFLLDLELDGRLIRHGGQLVSLKSDSP